MSADATRSLPDSRPLHDLISRARALLRSSWVATGLGITVGLLFGLLVVLTLIDLFVPFEPVTLPYFRVVVPLDPVFRCVALFLAVVPALLAFFHGVVRPLWRGLRPAQVARRIEDVRAFQQRQRDLGYGGDLVVKPLHGNGGKAVFRIPADGSNLVASSDKLALLGWRQVY